ncbi:hypothetical protein ACH5RR_014651 [Cinchona calisaya]|uniref:Uncharacterized protein n=1 Tax=Cinchona calisaya TaxID=153742 RepID=A0ABD2ZQW9_9GENT
MAEKVTTMILKADLQCHNCYKKVKKILSKFPQIRDRMFDEKNNLVKITVVCCSPEKIRDKLCCKGDKVIRRIEIVPPPAKPVDRKNQSTQATPGKPDEQQTKPGPQPYPAQPSCLIPVGYICVPCSEGYYGYGTPVPPPPCYDHYCYWYGWYGSRCDCCSAEYASACTIL